MTAATLAAELREVLDLVDHRGGRRHVRLIHFADRVREIARQARTIDPETAALADRLLAALNNRENLR